MMRQISTLLPIDWFLGERECFQRSRLPFSLNSGVPFTNTSHWQLEIVSHAEDILGPYILGYQAGSEPNLYARHGDRPVVRTWIP